jgi:glycosyltransferase involved in cell wall biosynthesis
MFGWEFPPHISGGLGTACYGLTKSLSKYEDVEILFVVPKAYGDEDPESMQFLGASQVPVNIVRFKQQAGEFKDFNYLEVGSHLIPYASPEEYYNIINKKEFHQYISESTSGDGFIEFSGKYGANLFDEIFNYSIVAERIAESNAFDAIHAHDWLTYPSGIAAKKISGKPLVIHVHATDFDRSGGSVNPRVFAIEKEGMEAADKIITVSNLTRDTVIHKYGIDSDKVITVYNGVEPLDHNPKDLAKKKVNEKVVTFLGRITLQKGPEYFIEAAYKVLQKMKNVRFVMAGSGDMMEKMIQRAAKLGITDKFHFTGFLKGQDVFKMYAHSDLYIMPSVSEPFGISPLEAMQSGVPVIVSKQSGVSEVLTHAIKVDFWDIDKTANAIYGVLNYPSLSHSIKQNGLEEAGALKWEVPAKKVREIYKTIV